MKPYTVSIEIDQPREKVVELFDNADNLFFWQEGLQSFEHLDGEPGQLGARSLMVYQNGKHRIELTETITNCDLPDTFSGTYEWGGGKNTLVNHFVDIDWRRTRWESTCTYEFHSFGLKLMGLLMPFMFKSQNMKFLKAFKAFAETGADVRENS